MNEGLEGGVEVDVPDVDGARTARVSALKSTTNLAWWFILGRCSASP